MDSLPTFAARARMSALAMIARECRSSLNIPVDFHCTWTISLLSDSGHATRHDAADRRFDFIREVASGLGDGGGAAGADAPAAPPPGSDRLRRSDRLMLQ
ncbi:hypothetical protein [Tritonibacter mobilis]|uniref:hypothetical protein n=1 Tax=Tritonibacter mobilis TaxID=379347 RepID=UPI0039A68E64